MIKATVIALLASPAAALVAPASQSAVSSTALHAYVPDGLSAAQWKEMQAKEKKAKEGKNFGAGGARGFKSRSFNSFVEAMEKG